MENRICVEINEGQNDRLSSKIASNKRHLIHELKIHGYVYRLKDKDFICSMCNSIDKDGNRTGGQLEVLDLSDANVYSYNDANERTIAQDMFNNCITLKKIILGEVYYLDARAFCGCTSLETLEIRHPSHFASEKGILYNIGKWEIYKNKYINLPYGSHILVKFPAGKKEVKDINFGRINQIADHAFEDFRGTDLYLPVIPPICSRKAFHNVDITNITLHVSKEYFNSYWCHPVWGQFQIVVEEKE